MKVLIMFFIFSAVWATPISELQKQRELAAGLLDQPIHCKIISDKEVFLFNFMPRSDKVNMAIFKFFYDASPVAYIKTHYEHPFSKKDYSTVGSKDFVRSYKTKLKQTIKFFNYKIERNIELKVSGRFVLESQGMSHTFVYDSRTNNLVFESKDPILCEKIETPFYSPMQ